MWVLSSQLAAYLEYSPNSSAYNDLVSSNNKIKFSELLGNNEHPFNNKKKFLKICGPPGISKKGINCNAIFINREGMKELLSKTQKPKSIDLAKFVGINVHHNKFVRSETDIVNILQNFCVKTGIKCKYQYNVGKYYIDVFLPDLKLAIEIDENDHKYYNQEKENERQRYIEEQLECKFIKCNPQSLDFNTENLIASIVKEII